MKRRKKKKNGESGTKIFFEYTPYPNTFPSIVPSLDIAREQHNSHKGGTREKHNS